MGWGDNAHMNETWAFLFIASSIQSNLPLVCYIILLCTSHLIHPLSNYLSMCPKDHDNIDKWRKMPLLHYEQSLWNPFFFFIFFLCRFGYLAIFLFRLLSVRVLVGSYYLCKWASCPKPVRIDEPYKNALTLIA
jgi:hypothetical protein